jgi:hypothetical protein
MHTYKEIESKYLKFSILRRDGCIIMLYCMRHDNLFKYVVSAGGSEVRKILLKRNNSISIITFFSPM